MHKLFLPPPRQLKTFFIRSCVKIIFIRGKKNFCHECIGFYSAAIFLYIQSVRESGMLLLPCDGDSREAQLGYVTFNRIQRSQYVRSSKRVSFTSDPSSSGAKKDKFTPHSFIDLVIQNLTCH